MVETGHWTFSYSAGSSTGVANAFTVAVDQTPGGDYTGVFMSLKNGFLNGVTYNVDEGADIFVVKPGEVFTKESIQAGQQPFIMGPSSYFPSNGGTVMGRSIHPVANVAVGQDFYLGAQTRSGTFTDFTTFGWAHFVVDSKGVSLKDSAMAFNTGGIIIGTLQAVPEPTTTALMSLGLVGMTWVARRKR